MSLPDMELDVVGVQSGGAYEIPTEYRVRLSTDVPDDSAFRMVVHTSDGALVGVDLFSDGVAEAVTDMAHHDHSLSGFADDWDIPKGMDRHIEWNLPIEPPHHVRLDSHHIDEIAAWLEYAVGEKEWVDGEEWSY